MLGQFGVTGDMAVQQVESLSGGQKSRVAFAGETIGGTLHHYPFSFAVLCGHNPNFLILDEPTNHLDIETIEALGHALIKYDPTLNDSFSNYEPNDSFSNYEPICRYRGGVILVSHDERLLKMVCQELWVCSKGKVRFLMYFGIFFSCATL